MSALELTGFCHISQGDAHLTSHIKNAVTGLGHNPIWALTKVNPDHRLGSHKLTIALTSEPLDDPNATPNVLTLGEKTEQDGIQIILAPLESPPSQRQLWTLEDVLPTKRFPPYVIARIQSCQCPDMSAGVGFMPMPLPRLYMNVSAVKNGDLGDDQKWTLDFVLP